MLAGTSVAYGHHVDHRSEVTEVIILQIARDITWTLRADVVAKRKIEEQSESE